jgi:hypothetical protein
VASQANQRDASECEGECTQSCCWILLLEGYDWMCASVVEISKKATAIQKLNVRDFTTDGLANDWRERPFKALHNGDY